LSNIKGSFLNILLLILGGAFSSLLLFSIQVILARELSPLYFGMFSASMATITLLAPLSVFGIQHVWLKVYGEEGYQANKYLFKSFIFISFSSLFTLALVVMWSFFGPHSIQFRNILLGLTVLIFSHAVMELVTSKLQLESKFSFLSFWQFLPNLLRFLFILGIVLIVSEGTEIHQVLVIYNLVAIIMILISFFYLLPMLRGKIKLAEEYSKPFQETKPIEEQIFLKNILSLASPFGFAAIFYLVYLQSDLILIKYLVGDEAVGIYNAAFIVILACYLIPGIIYQKFLLPRFHKWASYDKIKYLKYYQLGNGLMIVFGITMFLLLYLFIPLLHPLLFGKEYDESINVLYILIFCIPIRFLASSIEMPLFTKGFMAKKTRIMGFVALINVILNLLLIPVYSIYGAAVSTLISEILLLALYSYSVSRNVFDKRMWQGWFAIFKYNFWKNNG
tara:strand:- start:714 stop:2060 length:1347 start_codon:yes stop_codon:yes gene_type:complete